MFSEENSQPKLLILRNKEFFQVKKSKDSKRDKPLTNQNREEKSRSENTGITTNYS